MYHIDTRKGVSHKVCYATKRQMTNKTFIKVYLDPIQCKSLKLIIKLRINECKKEIIKQGISLEYALDLHNEIQGLSYLLDLITSNKDEELEEV